MKPSGADTRDLSPRPWTPLIGQARPGFSLLELILVLALVATLSAGLAVLGRGGSGGVVADAGVALVGEALAEARGLAVSRGVTARLIFPAAAEGIAGAYWLATANASGGWDAVGGVRSLPRDVSVRIAGGSSSGPGATRTTSTFSGRARFAVQGVPLPAARDWNYIEFRPAGTALPCLLVLDQGSSDGSGEGSRDVGLRGLRVSAYGTVTVLPGKECF